MRLNIKIIIISLFLISVIYLDYKYLDFTIFRYNSIESIFKFVIISGIIISTIYPKAFTSGILKFNKNKNNKMSINEKNRILNNQRNKCLMCQNKFKNLDDINFDTINNNNIKLDCAICKECFGKYNLYNFLK